MGDDEGTNEAPPSEEEPSPNPPSTGDKKAGGDSAKRPVDRQTETKYGELLSESDIDSEGGSRKGVCKKRRKKQKKKKKEDWPAIPVEYNPCPHLHFKSNILERQALTRKQHCDLLATPRGYRWEPDKELRYLKNGKGKKRKAKKRLKRAPKRTAKCDKEYIGHFLCEIWKSLPPKMVGQLHQLLVEEFGMSEREAENFIQEQKECAETQKEGKKKKKKPFCPSDCKVGVRHKWVKDFSRIFACKVTDYVVMMLCCKRTPRVRKLAGAILNHFNDITGEKATLNNPKTKLQRLLVFIADRIAVWLDSLIKESEEKKTADKHIEARLSAEAEEKPTKKKSKEKSVEKIEATEEEIKPKSPDSKASSKPSSKPQSKEGSKEPSAPASKPASKPSSKAASPKQASPKEGSPKEASPKEASKTSSKTSKPGTPSKEPSKQQIEEEEGEEEKIIAEEGGDIEAAPKVEEEADEEEEMADEGESELEEEGGLVLEDEEEEWEGAESSLSLIEGIPEKTLQIAPEEIEPKLPVIPPPALRGEKSLVYQITRGDGSFYNVHQISSGTVAEKTAEARNREKPERKHKSEGKPVTESPLNLHTMKDWADWANNVTDIAREWTEWIDRTVASAEEKAKMSKGVTLGADGKPKKLTKEEWLRWQAERKLEDEVIIMKKNKLKRDAEAWSKKIDKAAEKTRLAGPEVETTVTNFETLPEGDANQSAAAPTNADATASDNETPPIEDEGRTAEAMAE